MKQVLFVFVLLFTLGACKSKQNISSTNQTTSQERVDTRSNTGERPSRGEKGERKGPPDINEVFKMDANGDGKLAKSEIKGKLLERFDVIDANNDGFISRTEFQNAPKPERGQRPGGRNQ